MIRLCKVLHSDSLKQNKIIFMGDHSLLIWEGRPFKLLVRRTKAPSCLSAWTFIFQRKCPTVKCSAAKLQSKFLSMPESELHASEAASSGEHRFESIETAGVWMMKLHKCVPAPWLAITAASFRKHFTRAAAYTKKSHKYKYKHKHRVIKIYKCTPS